MFIGLAAILAIIALLLAVYGVAKQAIVYVGTATILVAIDILLMVGEKVYR